MISLVHKTVFVHIPKCGGQSVEEAFANDLGLDWEQHRALLLLMPKPARSYPGIHVRLAHLRAQEYREHYLPAELFDAFYRFALVRNPYDRIESIYFYHELDAKMSFEELVLRRLKTMLRKRAFFHLQSDFLSDGDGQLMVNDIFKLEEIGHHWQTIQSRTGLKTELPHRNKSSGRTTLSWTPEMRAVVETLYARDFENFGYAVR